MVAENRYSLRKKESRANIHMIVLFFSFGDTDRYANNPSPKRKNKICKELILKVGADQYTDHRKGSRLMSSSALQNVVKALTAIVEQT